MINATFYRAALTHFHEVTTKSKKKTVSQQERRESSVNLDWSSLFVCPTVVATIESQPLYENLIFASLENFSNEVHIRITDFGKFLLVKPTGNRFVLVIFELIGDWNGLDHANYCENLREPIWSVSFFAWICLSGLCHLI